MSKSPLATVKEKFGDKAKLVAAVTAFSSNADLWLAHAGDAKGLEHVSNAKLLRLLSTFTTVKEKFGTRAKLISTIVDLEKRTKDEGFKARLAKYPVPRLFDLYTVTNRRVNPTAKPAAKAAAKVPAKVAAKSATKTAKPAAKTGKGAR
jgi:hypothetical protein